MFEQFYSPTYELEVPANIPMYVRVKTCHGTRVKYGIIRKHKVLNLWKIGDIGTWYTRDDIINVSNKPNLA